ncbi:MAG: response regulator [Actinobacteria bacterium]|nr:response regulator [Actinomycetota bacterium]
MELAGGQIGVNAELDRGSTFWFVLPFAKAVQTDAEAGGPAEHLVGPGVAAASESLGKILVVEDDRVNQMVAVATVEALGYSVDVAPDGAEALNRLSQVQYSAVLMDCQMPKMGGYETTRQIRRLEGSMSQVPVVAMTAAVMEGDKEKCLAAGMDDYISKPIRPEIVKAALERWVSKQMVQP